MNTSASKIHILHAIRQGKIGGGETYILQLIDGMDKNVFQHTVLSFTDGPMIDSLKQKGVHCIVVPIRYPFQISFFFQLFQLIKNIHPDIIHVHGSRAASNLVPLANLLRIPVLYTIHGWSFHPGQPRFQFQLRRIAENLITRFTYVNMNVSYADQQVGCHYLKGYRSIVVRNGVELDKFGWKPCTRSVRQELSIAEDAIVIAFVARMTFQKNPFLLLKAFKQLLNTVNRQIFLIMAGDGELMPDINGWIKNNRLISQIRLLGFRQDVSAILHSSDIYCLPSIWEGMPIGLLEAMATKNAVVASDIPPHREVIAHAENGLLFTSQDEKSLFLCLHELCSSDDLRMKLQRAARHTVEREFDIHQTIYQIEKIYERIVNPIGTVVHTA